MPKNKASESEGNDVFVKIKVAENMLKTASLLWRNKEDVGEGRPMEIIDIVLGKKSNKSHGTKIILRPVGIHSHGPP